MLTIGSTPKLFKPRQDAMLALQTDLYADPVTGANADEVFEKDGQYFKLAKWRKYDITHENLPINGVSRYVGHVLVSGYVNNRSETTTERSFMAKYDGKQLTLDATNNGRSAPDQFNVGNKDYYPGSVWISISNTDSGWGDSYTPTPDEIKAYFMGWRMAQNVTGFPAYNGTGTKCWYQINTRSAPQTAFPTNSYAEWTPYQLVYQLATPTVEPITSEGQLTLIEGNNQVEVGTGIVLRELANPVYTSDTSKSYNINNFNASSKMSKRVNRILFVYKNNQRDIWEINNFNPVSETYGAQLASLPEAQYDPSATYSVTYLMLDTSPAAPFIGSVAENEKALLTDMNDILRQNAAAVSVVEAAINEAVRKQNKRNVWGPIG